MLDADARDALEEEQEFLLRSLDDLDAERAEGNVDEGTYARLRDDYTARAARVMHQLEGDAVDGGTEAAEPRRNGRRVLVGVGVVAFATLASVAMAYGLGARLPGQTITGRQSDSSKPGAAAADGLRALRARVKANPDDAEAHLALARGLMGAQDMPDALSEFGNAAKLDPSKPEAFAYSGWLIRLQGFPDQALTLLDKAIEIDPAYPDARAFKGILLLRDKHDPEGAIAQFQRYLVRAPDSPLADQVRTLLAQAVEAGRTSTTTTTTPTSSTTTKAP
jgi:cytochrome c-type biogenesis protein CcmH/NrfG